MADCSSSSDSAISLSDYSEIRCRRTFRMRSIGQPFTGIQPPAFWSARKIVRGWWSSTSLASNARVNLKNGTIIEMLFLNVNMTVESLFLLYLQEKFGAFFSYNLHVAVRVPHLWCKITWLIWNPNVFKKAAKIEFSKNCKKKKSFPDISEISPKRDITFHKETIENLKNRGNFPESCPRDYVRICYKNSCQVWLYIKQDTSSHLLP